MKKSTNANGDGGRGNHRDRVARRNFLLSEKAGWGGNGEIVPCAAKVSDYCDLFVTFQTMNVDRIVPGCLGGRYTRDNIRPTCFNCNNKLSHEQKAEVKVLRTTGQLAVA